MARLQPLPPNRQSAIAGRSAWCPRNKRPYGQGDRHAGTPVNGRLPVPLCVPGMPLRRAETHEIPSEVRAREPCGHRCKLHRPGAP